jgi:hypothetical protein
MVDLYITARPGADHEALWRTHAEELTTEWIAEHPGSRPWAWWKYDAPASRRCIDGAELLMPQQAPTDWVWCWHEDFGIPAFQQCRPRGYSGLPTVEAEATYLDRLELLLEDPGTALGPEHPLRPEAGLRGRAVGDERETPAQCHSSAPFRQT